MSTPSADYYLLGEDFDLSSSIKQEAPPYLPDPLLPAYNLKPMPHERRPSAFNSEHTFGAGPDNTSLRGFALAESIWSRDSDLTLDDLALDSDSASGRSRSSASSRWSAAPLTPATSPHPQLPSPREPAPTLVPAPTPVHPSAIPSATESVPGTPESPAPAYSRDPLEFDPALLASLDPQLRSRPFEAFEDMFWACFPDSPPDTVPYTSRAPNTPLSRFHPTTSRTSFTVHTSFSNSSMATLVAPLPPLPSPPPPPPPPAYPTSKPLPNLPPASPRSAAGHSQHDFLSHPPVVMSFESYVSLEDPPFPDHPPGETVHFFPLRAPARPRSKSVGGTKTVRRIAGAISRLRGRE